MSPPVESAATPAELVSPRSLSLSRSALVAVVGAGVSGLTCASCLGSLGFQVRVFDQGERPGGRASTRRAGRFHFDHGAQYFTVRDPDFAERIGEWLAEGTMALWHGRVRVLENGRISGSEDDTVRYVGVPGMGALAWSLARDSQVVSGVEIASVERRGKRWLLFDADNSRLGRFDLVLAAVPAPRAAALLGGAPRLAAQAETVCMAPTWAVLVGFSAPLELPFDGAFVHDSPLAWVARNASKPGRPRAEAWVLHASHTWSLEHLGDDRRDVADRLLEALSAATGERKLPSIEHVTAHRWRFAEPETPLPERCLFDPERGLGACGDWCGEPRVEGAYLSGLALAERVSTTWGDLPGPAV
jgi:renalase